MIIHQNIPPLLLYSCLALFLIKFQVLRKPLFEQRVSSTWGETAKISYGLW